MTIGDEELLAFLFNPGVAPRHRGIRNTDSGCYFSANHGYPVLNRKDRAFEFPGNGSESRIHWVREKVWRSGRKCTRQDSLEQ